jgi:hypothetical protein
MRSLAVALVAFAAACTPRAPVDRAIAARGGAIPGIVRESNVRVLQAFPGDWQWTTVAAFPDRYAWSIVTNDEPHHYLFDGTRVRAFIGQTQVAEATGSAGLETHSRFVAVANLDVLRQPGVTVTATPDGQGGTRLDATFADTGARYRIQLDRDDVVRRVEGPIDLSPMAKGTLVATYDDERDVDGRRLPQHIRYELDGAPLADERVVRSCVLAASPPPAAFVSPTALPSCVR